MCAGEFMLQQTRHRWKQEIGCGGLWGCRALLLRDPRHPTVAADRDRHAPFFRSLWWSSHCQREGDTPEQTCGIGMTICTNGIVNRTWNTRAGEAYSCVLPFLACVNITVLCMKLWYYPSDVYPFHCLSHSPHGSAGRIPIQSRCGSGLRSQLRLDWQRVKFQVYEVVALPTPYTLCMEGFISGLSSWCCVSGSWSWPIVSQIILSQLAKKLSYSMTYAKSEHHNDPLDVNKLHGGVTVGVWHYRPGLFQCCWLGTNRDHNGPTWMQSQTNVEVVEVAMNVSRASRVLVIFFCSLRQGFSV